MKNRLLQQRKPKQLLNKFDWYAWNQIVSVSWVWALSRLTFFSKHGENASTFSIFKFSYFLMYLLLIHIVINVVLQVEKERFVCITNYKAKAPGEVSVNEGDSLEILDDIGYESFLVCVVTSGAVGFLPRVLIIKAPDEDVKKAPKSAKGKEKEALHHRE